MAVLAFAPAALGACPNFGADVALTAGGSFSPAASTDYTLSGTTGTGYDFAGAPGAAISILNGAQVTGDPVISVTTDGGAICYEDTPAAAFTPAGDGLLLANLGSGDIDATISTIFNAPGNFAVNATVLGATGDITIAVSGGFSATDVGIVVVNSATVSGDIDITTAPGTIIGVPNNFAIGIAAVRAVPAGSPSGNIRIDNSAAISAPGNGSIGIEALLCDCTSGLVSVINRADIMAATGILAEATTTVGVQHLAGTITSRTVGIEAGGVTTSGQATVPVSVTVGAGATVIGDVGIGILETVPPPMNPATIIVAGTVMGTGGEAILLAGGSSRVELHPTYAITGLVDSASPGDTLALGGAGSGSFALGLMATQFTNFDAFEKSGTSTWTLTGTNAFAGPTNIAGGTLSLGTGASLPNSTVTLNGGTLAGNGTIGALVSNAMVAPAIPSARSWSPARRPSTPVRPTLSRSIRRRATSSPPMPRP